MFKVPTVISKGRVVWTAGNEAVWTAGSEAVWTAVIVAVWTAGVRLYGMKSV
jgi:hypothetical protein